MNTFLPSQISETIQESLKKVAPEKQPKMEVPPKVGKKMPMNFGHAPISKNPPKKEEIEKTTYCQLPDIPTTDFHLYNEHHLKNMLVGLNSDKPEIVQATQTILNHYLEFRKTKSDDFIPHNSEYIMPTHTEIKEMMKQKITLHQ